MLNRTISVIMPVFNSSLYLKDAVDSILNQTFVDFELIIIDDGSTDDSLKLIKSFNDPRILVVESSENKGIVEVLNLGIAMSKGKYIARMDSDDISYKNRLAVQYEFMEANPEILMCGSFYKILGTDNIVKFPTTSEEIKVQLLFRNTFGHSTVMFRSSVIIDMDLKYVDDFKYAEDYELWSRFAKHGKLANIPCDLIEYRIHPAQISTNKETTQVLMAREIGWKNFTEFISHLFPINYQLTSKIQPDTALSRLKFLNKLRQEPSFGQDCPKDIFDLHLYWNSCDLFSNSSYMNVRERLRLISFPLNYYGVQFSLGFRLKFLLKGLF